MDIVDLRNIHTVVYVSIKGRLVILAGLPDKFPNTHRIEIPDRACFSWRNTVFQKYFQKKMEQVLLFAGRAL